MDVQLVVAHKSNTVLSEAMWILLGNKCKAIIKTKVLHQGCDIWINYKELSYVGISILITIWVMALMTCRFLVRFLDIVDLFNKYKTESLNVSERWGSEHESRSADRTRDWDTTVSLLLLQTADQHPGAQLLGEEVRPHTDIQIMEVLFSKMKKLRTDKRHLGLKSI